MLVFTTAGCPGYDSKAEQYRPQHGEGKLVVKGKVCKETSKSEPFEALGTAECRRVAVNLNFGAIVREGGGAADADPDIRPDSGVAAPSWQWCGNWQWRGGMSSSLMAVMISRPAHIL